MSDISKINSLFGTKLGNNDPATPAKKKVVSQARTTQKQATQKQRNTSLSLTQNELADKKFNALSDRKYANEKVKTKQGKGNVAQGGAN